MDGGVYLRNDNHFGNGTEFNDLRVGMKATYQRWDMKVGIRLCRAARFLSKMLSLLTLPVSISSR